MAQSSPVAAIMMVAPVLCSRYQEREVVVLSVFPPAMVVEASGRSFRWLKDRLNLALRTTNFFTRLAKLIHNPLHELATNLPTPQRKHSSTRPSNRPHGARSAYLSAAPWPHIDPRAQIPDNCRVIQVTTREGYDRNEYEQVIHDAHAAIDGVSDVHSAFSSSRWRLPKQQ